MDDLQELLAVVIDCKQKEQEIRGERLAAEAMLVRKLAEAGEWQALAIRWGALAGIVRRSSKP